MTLKTTSTTADPTSYVHALLRPTEVAWLEKTRYSYVIFVIDGFYHSFSIGILQSCREKFLHASDLIPQLSLVEMLSGWKEGMVKYFPGLITAKHFLQLGSVRHYTNLLFLYVSY